MITRTRNFSALLGLAILTVLALGCAQLRTSGPAYSATATAAMNKALPTLDAARLDAIGRADIAARDSILKQTVQLPVGDGRTVEDAAVTDAFIRAKLLDLVRGTHITHREINTEGPEGIVTVSISLDQGPVNALLQDIRARSAK